MKPAGLSILLALCACNHGVLDTVTTGLTGSVMRAPITPVCQPEVPCSAPFSAHFTVWRGSHQVAAFLTDDQGHFTIRLQPGPYTVVPGPEAPILDPEMQTKMVLVGVGELTQVHFDFDTGLR